MIKFYKKIAFSSLIFLFFGIAKINGQNLSELKKDGKPSEPTFVYERPQNCALNTSFLMMDLKQNKDLDYLKDRYSLIEIENQFYVDAFLKIDKANFKKSEVENLGVKLNTEAGVFFTASIPINNLETLFSIEGILTVEIAEKVHTTMDSARTLTNVNQVHSGTGLPQAYTGNGVIVGVIDDGFDYTHPNFRNLSTQQTRISRVWEQNGTNTPPLPYGTEYVGSTAILNKMRDKVDESHGTHVTGIAAGSGGISTNSALRGVAYDSEIVLVPTNKTDTGIFNGIQYIFAQATSQNKPAVINMSLGGHLGPHDGTSAFDSACNSIIGPGKILVGSAGNEGDNKIHINKSLSSTSSLNSFINFPFSTLISKGSTVIDIWGEVGTNFNVAVNVFNVGLNSFIDWTPYVYTATNTTTITDFLYDNDITTSQDGCIVQIATESSNSNNNKPHAIITIDNSYQDDILNQILIEVRSNNGTVNAWICDTDLTGEFTDLSGSSGITAGTVVGATDGNTNTTVGEVGGTGNSIISVGAFTSKNTWTSLNNLAQNASFFSNIGAIAPFSSKGPTADGRIKPDITAPGNILASSVSSFDSNYTLTSPRTVSGLTDGTNNWLYGMMEGTSMSAPMVTGIIALWLQAKPNLTVAEIKNILQNSADTDTFTGVGSAIPNNIWGRGKIDAYGGIQYINQFLNLDTFNPTTNYSIYPNPTNSKIFITSSELVGDFELINVLGQKVLDGSFNKVLENQELDLSQLQNGLYFLNFLKGNKKQTIRLIKN